MRQSEPETTPLPRFFWILLALGLYLTVRGYQSFDGDQAYRLPLLLHHQDRTLFAEDPFVRSFEQFHPHRGSQALLDAPSRLIGLPATLFLGFALTFAVTADSVIRIARRLWPELHPGIAPCAVIAWFSLDAGNIGTNHLFEAMLLDRLTAQALGWFALAGLLERTRVNWTSTLGLALACLIHPSLGLQWVTWLAVVRVAWTVLGLEKTCPETSRWRHLFVDTARLFVASWPSLGFAWMQSGSLTAGADLETFRVVALTIQGPQHLVPSLWRTPQWLAFFCLTGLGLARLAASLRRSVRTASAHQVYSDASAEALLARRRIVTSMIVLSMALGLAWIAIEVVGNLRITLFQPFRMATTLRGLALFGIAARMAEHVGSATLLGRLRAGWLLVALTNDWSLVVVAIVEAFWTVAAWAIAPRRLSPRVSAVVPVLALVGFGFGLIALSQHDTARGHGPLLLATLAIVLLHTASVRWPARANRLGSRDRALRGLLYAWMVPTACLITSLIDPRPSPDSWTTTLVGHIRFLETPVDDVERLALRAQGELPEDAVILGPPGPKTFRLWSRRAVVFNRAASPYHADGLIAWAERFRDHVGFPGSIPELALAYLENRQDLEAGFDRLSLDQRARLAHQYGATHMFAERKTTEPSDLETCHPDDSTTPWTLLLTEGRYDLYRLDDEDSTR